MKNPEFVAWFRRQLDNRVPKMSQAEFARRAKIRGGLASDWYNGKRTPDPTSVDIIADVLGVDRDFVLALAGHRTPDEELSDDDPRRDLIAIVRRTRWTDERVATMKAILAAWDADDNVAKRKRPIAETRTNG